MSKVITWFNNIVQYENLSYGGLRTLNDIKLDCLFCFYNYTRTYNVHKLR